MQTRLACEKVLLIPPPPARFSLDEWYLHNRVRYRCNLDQQQLADRILTQSKLTEDQEQEIAVANKKETNHYLEERLKEIEFCRTEILKIRKEACLEVEALELYMDRIMDALKTLGNEAYRICRKCILLREGRIGIDLVYDDVEKELFKEKDVIEGATSLLRRTLEQAKEQVRRLRSTIYFIDRDLEDKANVLKLDRHNLLLDENSLNLSIYHGQRSLAASNITAEEWEKFTNDNLFKASKEKNCAIQFRSYVDVILKQVFQDLQAQYDLVNEAFRRRIEETKEAKTKLELQHFETARQANEMTRNITRLEKAIAEKEGYLALAHTRLGNRAQRPGMELCRDITEVKLVNEVVSINHNLVNLQRMMNEAQASLRYLLKTQIQMEEDINVKTNTLKIDEVDCMTVRQGINVLK